MENVGLKFSDTKGTVEISPKLTYFGESLEFWVLKYKNKELSLPFRLNHPVEEEEAKESQKLIERPHLKVIEDLAKRQISQSKSEG